MSAKVLFWDIETAPILAYVWGTFEQNVSLDQIHTDWHVLAWAAKWKDSKEVMYMDQRNAKDITNDKKILEGLWKLLDEADVVVTQNGIQFDAKKVNARFIEHGMKPPSPYKHVDTLRLAKKQFGFTSNKLAYMTNKLCEKYKKLDHGKFPGFSLWQECLKGNKKAWKEMETYNKHDVLALEELYGKLAPWGSGFNPNLYTDTLDWVCSCGGNHRTRKGFRYTRLGMFQKYICSGCGSESTDGINLFSKEKIASLKTAQDQQKLSRLDATLPLDSRECKTCGTLTGQPCGSQYVTGAGVFRPIRCSNCQCRYSVFVRALSKKEGQAVSFLKSQNHATNCSLCKTKKSCERTGVITLRKDGVLVDNRICRNCKKIRSTPSKNT